MGAYRISGRQAARYAGLAVVSGAALILLPHLARVAGYVAGAAEKAYTEMLIRSLHAEAEGEMRRRLSDFPAE